MNLPTFWGVSTGKFVGAENRLFSGRVYDDVIVYLSATTKNIRYSCTWMVLLKCSIYITQSTTPKIQNITTVKIMQHDAEVSRFF